MKSVIKRRVKILKIATTLMFVGAGVFGTSLIASLINAWIQEDVKSKTNYENANALHIQEQIDNLNQQYNNGEISAQKYQSEISKIPDLNVHDYMNTDPSVSTDVLNQYNASYTTQSVFSVGAMGGLGTALISSVAVLCAQKSLKNASDKTSRKDDNISNDEELELN